LHEHNRTAGANCIKRSHQQHASRVGVTRGPTKNPCRAGNRAFVSHRRPSKLSPERRISDHNIEMPVVWPLVVQRVAYNKNRGQLSSDSMRSRPAQQLGSRDLKRFRVDVHPPQARKRIEWRTAPSHKGLGRSQQKDAGSACGITDRKGNL
jgi:hypothetical protein